MSRRWRYLCVLSFIGLLGPTSAGATECAALAKLDLPSVRIDKASVQAAGTLPPDPHSGLTGAAPRAVEVGAHCLVTGKIDDRAGVKGRYGIRFEMRLPNDWNGRFLFQGGGGLDGFIAPAIGSIPNASSTARPALARGYAVVSMDGGHQGRDGQFGFDQQARLDLAYAAIGPVTDTARALIRRFYARKPVHSLFMGCSNGGREAMMAAERYPTRFDGIVAGNPGVHMSTATLAQVWDTEQLRSIAPDGNLARALTPSDMDTVADAILAHCDARDGLADGVVAAPSACDFDPETLRGRLADDKLDALIAVMDGPTDAAGHLLYADWPYDPGIASNGWRVWKLGFAEPKNTPAFNTRIGPEALTHLFMTPPRAALPDKPLDYAALANEIAPVGAYFDADTTYLSTFARRGGKMLIFQGLADPVFSPHDLVAWARQAAADTDATFLRLFLVPGMTHCGGGPAFNDFDPLRSLERWIDTDTPPRAMPATGTSFPGRTMPICAYPKEAYYTGKDPASRASFSCR